MRICNIPFSIQVKKITLNYPKSAPLGFFPKGLKNKLEIAVVNEPSVFQPLKIYCIYRNYANHNRSSSPPFHNDTKHLHDFILPNDPKNLESS